MSKFTKVMTAKVAGYNTVRRFGVDLLVQIIIVAILYQVSNHFKLFGDNGFGPIHFATSVTIIAAITAYQIYKRKLLLMRDEDEGISNN